MKKQGLLNNTEDASMNAPNLAVRATKGRTSLVAAEGWVEHLEDEMEPLTFDEDLELLLQNSEEDRALFESLKQTRILVKKSDDVALPESGQFYDNLHSKIMAAIEQDEILNGSRDTRVVKRTRKPFAWPQVFGAVGMTMMLAIVAMMSLKTSNVDTSATKQVAAAEQTVSAEQAASNEHFERRLAMVDPRMGAIVARELGGFESEEDFLTETAAARLKQISAGEAREMLYDLGH